MDKFLPLSFFKRLLKEGGVDSHNYNSLNKKYILREFIKIAEYPVHQSIRLGRLEIYILFKSHHRPGSFSLRKQADIWGRYHWFPRQMTSEKRAQKFHTDDVSLLRTVLHCTVLYFPFFHRAFVRDYRVCTLRRLVRFLEEKTRLIRLLLQYRIPATKGPYL